jgi:transcriptional antiterminator NusG
MDGYWYVIHTYSGHEKKVKDNLEQRVKAIGMADEILRIFIPTQQVAEVKNGKKRVYMKTFFPGYILVQTAKELHPETPSERDQKIWHTINEIPGVMGFVGSGTTPTPLNKEEVQNILQVSKGEEEQKTAPVITFAVGDKVKVTDGHFIGFPGEVSSIDQEKQKLIVMISIFGRSTPVELEFFQVEKI